MSGSVFGGGNTTSIATAATGAVVLPFTHGSVIISYVILTAVACAVVVLASKIVKRVVTHFNA